MPKPKPALHELIERREFINEKFIEYSALDRVAVNYSALANLALIGGRLDKLIKDQASRENQERRNAGREALANAYMRSINKDPLPDPVPQSALKRIIARLNSGCREGGFVSGR